MSNIAIIEDEEAIRNNIKEILELEKFNVFDFSLPQKFIDFAEKNENLNKIDIIISDILMPEINGIEMINKILKKKSLENLPVIFLSALGDQDIIESAYQISDYVLAVDYVTKPFQIFWFIAKIKSMIKLKHKNDQLKKAYENITKTNLEIQNLLESKETESDYLKKRLKNLLGNKHSEIEKKLQIINELLVKIATNDIASLRFVCEILEKNQKIIERIVREPTEEDNYFKIIPKTVEPLKTVIWNFEQTIYYLIDLGLIKRESLENANFEETAFYEILQNYYKAGGFSPEQFQQFIEKSKFTLKNSGSDVILF